MATTWTPDATDLYYASLYDKEVNTGLTGLEIYTAQVNEGFDFNNSFIEEASKLANVNNGLSEQQNANIKANYNSAKLTGNDKLAKVMDYVFKYGEAALKVLVSTGIIKTGSTTKAITPDDVDTQAFDNYVQNTKTKVAEAQNKQTNTPSNSTYFGIDFSSPIVWLIIVAVVILLFSLNGNKQPQQVYLPQPTAKR